MSKIKDATGEKTVTTHADHVIWGPLSLNQLG